MISEQFYDVLDKELEIIIQNNLSFFKKFKQINQQKSNALLIWFLQMYAPKTLLYQNVITDGKDDNSCDIIFSSKEDEEEVFYVVQSKWNVKPNYQEDRQSPKMNIDEVKKAIIDFESIFRTDKPKGKNELFNQKLTEIYQHRVKNGGSIKFIFLSLMPYHEELNEYIRNFEQNYSPSKLEILDIERLKRDYIEFKFKQIQVENPLHYKLLNPINDKVTLPIERIENAMGKGDHIKIEKPYESYVFLLKPKTIFELFEKYNFALFFSNVRNPLPQSNYNQEIINTMLKKPDMFWYFNNGITAITKLVKPIGFDAEVIHLSGLQIINGSQTFYSVYSAYKNANKIEREVMDTEAKIMFRLIRSNNDDMNLEITRYANSQNPMESRDFWANDAIQIELQEQSFKTKYWYEKRRGEFRILPDDITIVSNEVLAKLYMMYFFKEMDLSLVDKIFTSYKFDKEGIYEHIFDKNTQFENMLMAFLVHNKYEEWKNKHKKETKIIVFDINIKIVLEKYLSVLYPNIKDFYREIKKMYDIHSPIFFDIFDFMQQKIKQFQTMKTKKDLIFYFENLTFTEKEMSKSK